MQMLCGIVTKIEVDGWMKVLRSILSIELSFIAVHQEMRRT
jgi:hypothetical protein